MKYTDLGRGCVLSIHPVQAIADKTYSDQGGLDQGSLLAGHGAHGPHRD